MKTLRLRCTTIFRQQFRHLTPELWSSKSLLSLNFRGTSVFNVQGPQAFTLHKTNHFYAYLTCGANQVGRQNIHLPHQASHKVQWGPGSFRVEMKVTSLCTVAQTWRPTKEAGDLGSILSHAWPFSIHISHFLGQGYSAGIPWATWPTRGYVAAPRLSLSTTPSIFPAATAATLPGGRAV